MTHEEWQLHGDVSNRYWGSLYNVYPEFQLVLYDETGDTVLGEGNTIPCSWDETVEGLPAGIDEVIDGFPQDGRLRSSSTPTGRGTTVSLSTPGSAFTIGSGPTSCAWLRAHA